MVLWTCLIMMIFLRSCYGQSPDVGGTTSTVVVAPTSSVVQPTTNACDLALDNCNDLANCVGLGGLNFNCVCLAGYNGSGVSFNGCTDIDECSAGSDTCDTNAECVNTIGSFLCICKTGFLKNAGSQLCTDIDECASDADNNCVSPAICVNTVGSFTCDCPQGFNKSGQGCVDNNECDADTDNCDTFSNCENTVGSYVCTCISGYVADTPFTCTDINECGITPNVCDQNARCNNTAGSFSCICTQGFSGDGISCIDIDECSDTTNPRCDVNAVCNNTAGGFSCVCKMGYEGSGIECANFNECANAQDNNCESPATCLDTEGSFNCTCPTGYEQASPTSCLDIDESKLVPSVCPVGSTTQNALGTFTCVCNSGYSGDPCADIDECQTTNQCNANANCTNTVGNYICICKKGFQGNGIQCEDNNECLIPLGQCAVGAVCKNNPGSFECVCADGYTGDGVICTDVNECGNNPCDQLCVNTPGSYVCSCNKGYTFTAPQTCTDINECDLNTDNCDANANCANTPGSFTCKCNTGFRGNGVECVVDHFAPFIQCSTFLQGEDVGQSRVLLQNIDGFPLEGVTYNDVFVCVNGFISIRKSQCEQGPNGDLGTPLPEGLIFAPFFADIDTRIPAGVTPNETNRVYYCQYQPSDLSDASKFEEYAKVQANVQNTVRSHTNAQTFVPTNTIVASWNEVRPFPSTTSNRYFNSNQKATFQVVLTTDGENTFVYYVYFDMNWKSTAFNVQVGYRYNQVTDSLTPNVRNGFSRLRFDKATFGTSTEGLWIRQVSDRVQQRSALDCNAWAKKQPTVSQIANLKTQRRIQLKRRSCPCCLQQAVYDRRYQAENSLQKQVVDCVYKRFFFRRRCGSVANLQPYCIQRKNIWFLQDTANADGERFAVVTRCCYDIEHGGLLKKVSGQPQSLTQNHFIASTQSISAIRRRRANFRNQAINGDTLPFQQCCRDSGKCDLYEARTIIPQCSNYVPNRRASQYGDPHMLTLDEYQYTFNGLDDYHLVKTDSLQIQTRTCKAFNNIGNVDATVFCGFAMTDVDEAVVELYYDIKSNTTTLIVNGTERPLADASYGNTDITYEMLPTEGVLTVAFLTGNAVEIHIFSRMLQGVVSLSDELAGVTQGLLGNFDGDKTNDLVNRNGVTLSPNATERDIYYDFGLTWAVGSPESLFSQIHDGLDSTFLPIFFTSVEDLFDNNVTAINYAKSVCGDVIANKECFFDLALTNDETLAVDGQTFIGEENQITTIIQTEAPVITGPIFLNVTFQQPITFFIEAVSNSTVTGLTYFINTNFSSSFTLLDNKTGEVQFRPIARTETIEVGVLDEFGLSALQQVRILYCYCENHGECDFSKLEIEGEYFAGVYLNFFQCVCQDGFTGSHCETRVDVCLDTPCFANVSCTPTTVGVSHVAECDNCPIGFTGDGRKCFDIDDCIVLQPCEQQCENSFGSYSCSCFTGYQPSNATHCDDVDECQNTTVAACPGQNEMCENTVGSFQCVCISGYRRNGTGSCIDINECAELTDDCVHQCVNTPGSYECQCLSGYTGNGVTCTDIDECDLANDCHSEATCTNTDGGYLCFCKAGYDGNGKACQDLNECDTIVRQALGLTLDCSTRCRDTVGSYVCECNAGFTLGVDRHTCTEVLNPCLTGNNNCDSKAICTYVNKQVNCNCISGYTGNGESCQDIIECSLKPDVCAQNCVNTLGSYNCVCNTGYSLTTNGSACDDVDECIFNLASCPSNSRCANEIGSFKCNCNNGFQKNATTNNCDDINECDSANGGCSQLCNNNVGSFTCGCNSGYSLNKDGKTCDNINECLLSSDDCDVNALCTDTTGSFTCLCNSGYTGNGKTCTNINECGITGINNCVLQSRATCIDNIGSFTCRCPVGYSLDPDGITCTETNECLLGTANCAENSTCVNEPGEFVCKGLCPGDCEQRCNDTANGYKCYCSPGYIVRSGAGNKCDDVDECIDVLVNDCHANATCVNTFGSYVCQCNNGLTGDGKTACQPTTTSTLQYSLNGSIALNDSIVNNSPVDLTDSNTVKKLEDPTSELYVGYKIGVEAALLAEIKKLQPGVTSVKVTSLIPTSTEVKVVFETISVVPITTTPVVLSTNLAQALASQSNKLNVTGFQAVAVTDSILITDINECSTNKDRCHKDSVCANTIAAYTCTCKNGFEGNGSNCIAVARLFYFNAELQVFNTQLDGKNIDLTDPATANALADSSSSLFNSYAAAVQDSLLKVLQSLSPTVASVTVKKIIPINDSVSTTIDYEITTYDNHTKTLSQLQADLIIALNTNKNLLTDVGFQTSVRPSFVKISGQNECTNNNHRCHEKAACNDVSVGYTCSCNSGFEGDGLSCTEVTEGTSDGIIIAVAVTLSIAFLILVGLIILFLIYRKRRKSTKDSDTSSSYDGSTSWTPFPFGQMRARSMYMPRGVVPTQYKDIPQDQR